MNKCKIIIASALLILGGASLALIRVHGARDMTTVAENRSVPLSQFLMTVGETYDRFFTIEEAWKTGESMNSLEARLIQTSSQQKTVEKELESLRQAVPNFTYEVDKSNPRIVHIIDARLAETQGYGLESVIKSIDFTGSSSELVATIGRQGISVSPQRALFTNEFQDYDTVIHVRGEGLRVREALSNFVPLGERRGRILWIARKKLGEGEVTYVYYPSPGKKS